MSLKINVKKITVTVVAVLGITFIANAQVNLAFANKLGANSFHGDFVRGMVKDSQGNLYLTGFFHDTMDFDPDPNSVVNLTSSGDGEIFLAKYNPSGGFIWAKKLNTNPNNDVPFVQQEDRAEAITIDENDNVYLIGTSFLYGSLILKYDSLGNFVWAKQLAANPNFFKVVDIKANNNTLYIAGSFTGGSVDFDPSANQHIETASSLNGFLLALDYNGTFRWVNNLVNQGGAASLDINNFSGVAASIAIDSFGEVYLSGTFDGQLDLDPSIQNQIVTSQRKCCYVAKFNHQTGDLLWGKQFFNDPDVLSFGFPLNFNPKIICDFEDNILMTASYNRLGSNNVIVIDSSTSTTINNQGQGFFLTKFNSQGNYIWSKIIINTNPAAEDLSNNHVCSAFSLDSDNCGNIYISGEIGYNFNFDPSNTNFILNVPFWQGRKNIFVASYSKLGDFKYVFPIEGTTTGNGGTATAVEPNGRLPIVINGDDIYLAGTFDGTMDFDPTSNQSLLTTQEINSSSIQFFLAKYTSTTNACTLSNTDILKDNEFNIYPNPSKGLVNINFNHFVQNVTIEMFDVLGKSVLINNNVSGDKISINTSGLMAGIYMIKIQDGENISYKKIIVE